MKRGFTLIELLAVIVILAIIALIAVPIVINMIDDAKKNSEKESIKLYLDTVQKAIARKQLENTSFDPKSCVISEKKLTCSGTEVAIDMKGDTPTNGTLYFNNGRISIGENILLNGLYYQVKNGEISEGTTTSISGFALVLSQIESSVGNVSGTCTITGTNKITCGTDPEKTIGNIGEKTITGGTITFTNGTATEYKNVNVDGTYYHKKAGEEETTTNEEVYLCTKVTAASNTSITKGDKYTCNVSDNDTRTFYVLTDPADGKVNLIMDRNICNDGSITYTSTNNYCMYKWYSSANNNTYGPTTVMAELYAGTKDWDNVDDMIMNYIDENNGTAEDKGYTSIITSNGVTTITGKPTTNTTTVGTASKPLKARLPKESEVTGAGCTTSAGSCPVWLMEYMTYYNVSNDKYSMNNNSEAYQNHIYGYWLLSSSPGYSFRARFVDFRGGVNYNDTTNGYYGARPVITVSTSDLS